MAQTAGEPVRPPAGPPVQVNALDASGTNGFGNSATSVVTEHACSLNANPAHELFNGGAPISDPRHDAIRGFDRNHVLLGTTKPVTFTVH
jgi:hypothetical protein